MNKRRIMSAGGVLAALAILLLGIGLIAEGKAVGEGVWRGLSLCGEVLIPSLFPFMALSCWISRTDVSRILSIPLSPLTRYVFRLRQDLGATVLLSAVGGYPVGAKMIASLLEQKRISTETAERMICFCFGGSPSFLISAVGAGMFLSRKTGVMLYIAQVTSTLLVGALLSLSAPKIPREKVASRKSEGAVGFVAAVNDASAAMIAMCAWAILFSAMLAMVSASGFSSWIAGVLGADQRLVEGIMAGAFEVTSGCLYTARLGGRPALLLTCLICSFGGLSAIFQAISCFKGKLRFGKFLCARLLHGILSTGLFLWMQKIWGNDIVAVMLPCGELVPQTSGGQWLAWGCILAMCTMLFAGYRSPKIKRSADSVKSI